jgi:hypothetical protein
MKGLHLGSECWTKGLGPHGFNPDPTLVLQRLVIFLPTPLGSRTLHRDVGMKIRVL